MFAIVLLSLLPVFLADTVTETDLLTTLATITSCEGGCHTSEPSNITSYEGGAVYYKPLGVAAGFALAGLIM